MVSAVTFEVEEARALMRAARAAVTISPDGPAGWSRSRSEPTAVLAAFPRLRLRPGWTLRAYQFRKEANGNAIVWAVPAESAFAEPADCQILEEVPLTPPRPPGALERAMLAVEGDGSPLSYLSASLLARELAEFGALGRGVHWGNHQVVDRAPAPTFGAWRWLKARPVEWRPAFWQEDWAFTVVFHSQSAAGRQALFRHEDTYNPGDYACTGRETIIALGGAGRMP